MLIVKKDVEKLLSKDLGYIIVIIVCLGFEVNIYLLKIKVFEEIGDF